ncbi:MAG TPA: PHP domain-containing protein [Candidatus Limnocylindrales bacterium]|nr:PHP domain-containing protein [Candidatus Limnocylindrales bacterium]
MASGGVPARPVGAFIDLHCHTSASFDSLASPRAVVQAAARRGLTHLAITDHDRIEGALEARDAAPDGLTVLIGEEIRTRDGDLIAVFLSEAVPPGLSASETIAAIRAQGGLVGIPHPFDRFRGSLSRSEDPRNLEALAASVDWIEAWNARLMFGGGNAHAADLALAVGVPGVAVSDAHTTVEVGVASTIVQGDPSTPEGLRAALAAGPILATGRASFYVRLVTPLAKAIQRSRGHGRVRPAVTP